MKKLLITLPCFNEELILEKSARTVLDYAKEKLGKYNWSVLIIDNTSSDRTFEIANKLAQQNPRVLVGRCMEKGRGAALRSAWQEHNGYDIYSYMDIDLATDLGYFAELSDKIGDGYHIAAGSRYVPGARTERSLKRRFMSKVYNLLLRIFLKVNFKDAQCGFKAFNKEVIAAILPKTFDSGWFWDTEFMVWAERGGYKIIEIPVTWKEVRDELRKSKVSPFTETFRQLKNIFLMRRKLKNNI